MPLRRRTLLVACFVSMLGGGTALLLSDGFLPSSGGARSVRDARPSASAVPTPTTSPIAKSAAAAPVSRDWLADYAALRDDIDPKPRFRLLDDWARQVDRADAADLVAQAMVDPDEQVRLRAQSLFDRTIDDGRRRQAVHHDRRLESD